MSTPQQIVDQSTSQNPIYIFVIRGCANCTSMKRTIDKEFRRTGYQYMCALHFTLQWLYMHLFCHNHQHNVRPGLCGCMNERITESCKLRMLFSVMLAFQTPPKPSKSSTGVGRWTSCLVWSELHLKTI